MQKHTSLRRNLRLTYDSFGIFTPKYLPEIFLLVQLNFVK